MVVPLAFKEKIYGYCYLANVEVNEYFDARSQRVVSPLASQAAITYQNFILASAKEEKARLDAELNAARAVQNALLPNSIDVPSLAISYFYEPASQTGGDWFHHHYDSRHRRLYAFVGDVTGKGLPSAMLTAVVSGAIQSHLKKDFEKTRGDLLGIEESLQELAEIANYAVFSAGSRNQRFMTMSFACLDLQTGDVGIVNAGHPPPYIFNLKNERVSTLPCSGSLLGFSDNAKFGFASHRLEPGDCFFLYTDGLIENMVADKPILNSRSLRKSIQDFQNPRTCVENIAQMVRHASKEQPLEDDVTVYMFRWSGAPTTAETASEPLQLAV